MMMCFTFCRLSWANAGFDPGRKTNPRNVPSAILDVRRMVHPPSSFRRPLLRGQWAKPDHTPALLEFCEFALNLQVYGFFSLRYAAALGLRVSSSNESPCC